MEKRKWAQSFTHNQQPIDSCWEIEYHFFTVESHWVYQWHAGAGPCSGGVGQHKVDSMFLACVCLLAF